jgi:hypothetical protein
MPGLFNSEQGPARGVALFGGGDEKMSEANDRVTSSGSALVFRVIALRLKQLEKVISRLEQEKAVLGQELEHTKRLVKEQDDELASLRSRQQLSSRIYIGSIDKSTFHLLTCKWVQGLKRSENQRWFLSREEAITACYKPCKTCCA